MGREAILDGQPSCRCSFDRGWIIGHHVEHAIRSLNEVGLDPAGPLSIGAGCRRGSGGSRAGDQKAAPIINEIKDAALPGGDHGECVPSQRSTQAAEIGLQGRGAHLVRRHQGHWRFRAIRQSRAWDRRESATACLAANGQVASRRSRHGPRWAVAATLSLPPGSQAVTVSWASRAGMSSAAQRAARSPSVRSHATVCRMPCSRDVCDW